MFLGSAACPMNFADGDLGVEFNGMQKKVDQADYYPRLIPMISLGTRRRLDQVDDSVVLDGIALSLDGIALLSFGMTRVRRAISRHLGRPPPVPGRASAAQIPRRLPHRRDPMIPAL